MHVKDINKRMDRKINVHQTMALVKPEVRFPDSLTHVKGPILVTILAIKDIMLIDMINIIYIIGLQ